jgi:hypothetical protein
MEQQRKGLLILATTNIIVAIIFFATYFIIKNSIFLIVSFVNIFAFGFAFYLANKLNIKRMKNEQEQDNS